MKVERRETTNPRARQPVRYDITALTAEEFKAICKALELMPEDKTAASLLSSFNGLASALDGEKIKADTEALTEKLKQLKHIIDD